MGFVALKKKKKSFETGLLRLKFKVMGKPHEADAHQAPFPGPLLWGWLCPGHPGVMEMDEPCPKGHETAVWQCSPHLS